jgi:hypothetical protein
MMFWMILLTTFLNFSCFLLYCAILVLSCTPKHFCLVDCVRQGHTESDKGCRQTCLPCLYCLVLLTGAEAFIVIFVVFNDKLLAYNLICCTTRRC